MNTLNIPFFHYFKNRNITAAEYLQNLKKEQSDKKALDEIGFILFFGKNLIKSIKKIKITRKEKLSFLHGNILLFELDNSDIPSSKDDLEVSFYDFEEFFNRFDKKIPIDKHDIIKKEVEKFWFKNLSYSSLKNRKLNTLIDDIEDFLNNEGIFKDIRFYRVEDKTYVTLKY